MRYEDLFVGLLLIVLLIVAAVRILAPKSPDAAPTRSEGELHGSGTLTSAPLELAAGSYRIDYQFDTLTRLALIDAASEETLLITSGTGTQGFEIALSGRYRLRLEPANETAAWMLSYRQIS